jgi:DNA repair photolyase
MNVTGIRTKTILSVSRIYDYVTNPYAGCQHACSYGEACMKLGIDCRVVY